MNKEYYMAEFNGLRSNHPLTDQALAYYLEKIDTTDWAAVSWWGSVLLDCQTSEVDTRGESIVPKERKHGRI